MLLNLKSLPVNCAKPSVWARPAATTTAATITPLAPKAIGRFVMTTEESVSSKRNLGWGIPASVIGFIVTTLTTCFSWAWAC